MFCGWYFRRDEPTRVIDFAAGDVSEDGDPVRVRDVASEVMQGESLLYLVGVAF